jgi:AbrB family looped-hinge helix DNA binding protein
MPALSSRLTVKGQTTIPKTVRERLGLRRGDLVVFEVDDDRVTLRKATPLDRGFIKLSEEAFADWSTAEADEAFRDL